MISPHYEVEMILYPDGWTNWMVMVTLSGHRIGKTRHFRTFYFAKRHHDKLARQLNTHNHD